MDKSVIILSISVILFLGLIILSTVPSPIKADQYVILDEKLSNMIPAGDISLGNEVDKFSPRRITSTCGVQSDIVNQDRIIVHMDNGSDIILNPSKIEDIEGSSFNISCPECYAANPAYIE